MFRSDTQIITSEQVENSAITTQTSSGLLHAGYPIVANLDVLQFATNLPLLRDRGCWPLFHEIAHNFTDECWTFDGFEEVS